MNAQEIAARTSLLQAAATLASAKVALRRHHPNLAEWIDRERGEIAWIVEQLEIQAEQPAAAAEAK